MSKEANDSNTPAEGREIRTIEGPLEVDTHKLLGKRSELTIIHNGERYRLRVTSQNKLILTK